MYQSPMLAVLLAACSAAHAADPQEVWEQVVQAKGGRERLHRVHSLAVYLKPAPENLAGPPANWLCVFPDRYFEFDGAGAGAVHRALAVDATAGHALIDETGKPRATRHLTRGESDRLTLNQLLFLTESNWLRPELIEVRHNVLTVQAGGRQYKIYLDKAHLPERILSLRRDGEKNYDAFDYRLQKYRDFGGIMLPSRVIAVGRTRESHWDADYEVDAKYNPKVFERMPDLANGPEPWRMR